MGSMQSTQQPGDFAQRGRINASANHALIQNPVCGRLGLPRRGANNFQRGLGLGCIDDRHANIEGEIGVLQRRRELVPRMIGSHPLNQHHRVAQRPDFLFRRGVQKHEIGVVRDVI